MNNFKKIGLTALAGSLVATSAFAGELTATGAASISVANITGTNDQSTGKNFSMANDVVFSGSGELDNGLTVSTSFELDNGDEAGNGPFDNHSVTIASDSLGTLVFSGHGGSSAASAMDTTAAGDIWNNTLGITGIPAGAAAGNDSLYYTLPSLMDGVTVTASLSPGEDTADQHSRTSYGISFTGIEGLTINYATGDSGAKGSKVTSDVISASYAMGAFSLGYSMFEDDSTNKPEITGLQLGYTVSDDLSVTYGQETITKTGGTVDQEVEHLGVSYTTGGMTLTADTYEAKNGGFSSGAKTERWALGASFAF
jgi:outer membrane protein OmpU